MLRSRLPVPTLFCLFGALLMLSAELLGFHSYLPVTDPEVQERLAISVEQYNKDRSDSANYYKVLSLVTAKYKVEMVKTTCGKKDNMLTYEKIQKCEQLPGNQEKKTCYFRVTHSPQEDKMFLVDNICR